MTQDAKRVVHRENKDEVNADLSVCGGLIFSNIYFCFESIHRDYAVKTDSLKQLLLRGLFHTPSTAVFTLIHNMEAKKNKKNTHNKTRLSVGGAGSQTGLCLMSSFEINASNCSLDLLRFCQISHVFVSRKSGFKLRHVLYICISTMLSR